MSILEDYNHDHQEDEPDLTILNQDRKETVVITPKENGVADQEDLEILNNLPDLDIEFNLSNDKAKKILSLKDVEDQIVQDDNIDSVRADVVQESFGDLYQSLNASGFTKIPTRVNLKETKKYMRQKISAEAYELLDTYKTYISKPYTDATAVLEAVKESYFPGLLRISESLISELQTNKDKVLNNPSRLVPAAGGVFLDLTKIDFLKFDPATIRTNLKTINEFGSAIRAIQQSFECSALVRFVSRYTEVDIEHNGITLVDLTNFILNPDALQSLAGTANALNEDRITIAGLVAESEKLAAKPELVAQFVVDNASKFLEFHHNLKSYVALVYHLTILNLAIKQILLTYYEL